MLVLSFLVALLVGWCAYMHHAILTHKRTIVRITEEMANAMHDFNNQVEEFNLFMAQDGEPVIEFTLEDDSEYH